MSPGKISARQPVSWVNKLKVPVYEFLKEALIRKYGTDFYATLEATAAHLKKDKA